MIYFLGDIGDRIGSAIVDGLRALNLTISSLFYRLIIDTFNIFIKIGNSTIIHDNEALLPILNRISIILGIFMLFRVTFAFIEYIVNPDNMFDKNKGMMNIVKRIVIAIVLLGSTNMIFNFAYDLQDKIVTEDVIPQIILGDTSSIEDNEKGSGGDIAEKLFTCFFRPNEKFIDEDYDIVINSDDEINENTIRNIQYKGIKEEVKYGVFEGAKSVINVKADTGNGEKEYLYEFDAGGFGCLALGIFALYIIVTYTIQVGVRLFQLAYLQVIAPIPIMMYITPKGDENIKKWGKQCATTYLDFFIRTAIMYFIIFVIKIITNSVSMSSLMTGKTFTDGYITAILIIGLLLFAKKLPNLLKEIFPSLGGSAAFDYGLNLGKNVKESMKTLYNAPVLGWAPKLVAGGVHGIDRVANGKKFFAPPKFMKKVLPETAARMEEKEKANLDIRDRKALYSYGNKLYDDYNQYDKFVDDDGNFDESNLGKFTQMFKNAEYRESFKEVQRAKDKLKNVEAKAEEYRMQAALGKISTEDADYIAAQKALKKAQGNLSEKQKNHDMRKIKFKDDARREAAYEYYKNTNPTGIENIKPFAKHMEEKTNSSNNGNTESPQPQNNTSQTPPDAGAINNQSSSSNQNNTSGSTNNSLSSSNRSEQQSDPRDGLYNNDYDENGEITQSFTPGDE